MGRKVRPLTQRDWDQLLIVATGFLPITGGDLEAAMARAIVAHASLIESVKKGGVKADLARGTVRLFVPEGGGLALAFESNRKDTPGGTDEYADLGPPDITLEVLESPSSYTGTPSGDAGPHDDEGWTR